MSAKFNKEQESFKPQQLRRRRRLENAAIRSLTDDGWTCTVAVENDVARICADGNVLVVEKALATPTAIHNRPHTAVPTNIGLLHSNLTMPGCCIRYTITRWIGSVVK